MQETLNLLVVGSIPTRPTKSLETSVACRRAKPHAAAQRALRPRGTSSGPSAPSCDGCRRPDCGRSTGADSEWVPLHALALLAITTGARRGELVSLKWADVDLKTGRATIHDTKNGEHRTLPLAGWYRRSRSGQAPASGNGRRSVLDEPTKQAEGIRSLPDTRTCAASIVSRGRCDAAR